MKRYWMVIAFVLAASGFAYSQAEQTKPAAPKHISGGVLNGKAVSLPKPAYPPAARAVNAEGAVSVQVLVDELGNVESASAVSGHPLLRGAAVDAAKAATFSPTLLAGTPVKVSGVIVYNFVGSLTPTNLGFELAHAERTGRFGLHAKSLAAQLPQDWASEKAVLESLSYESMTENSVNPPDQAASDSKNVRDPNKFTVRGDSSTLYSGGKLTPESLSAIRGLLSGAESRFAAEPQLLWTSSLGRGLGVLMAELGDAQKLAANAATLEQLAATAPASVSGDAVIKLNKLIELTRSGQPSVQDRREISDLALGLRNLRAGRW